MHYKKASAQHRSPCNSATASLRIAAKNQPHYAIAATSKTAMLLLHSCLLVGLTTALASAVPAVITERDASDPRPPLGPDEDISCDGSWMCNFSYMNRVCDQAINHLRRWPNSYEYAASTYVALSLSYHPSPPSPPPRPP